ncbi:MAG: RNA polymerase sigma factor [Candidatus Poribacteria bacterium]
MQVTDIMNDDKLLVQKFQQGDKDAFDELVKKYQDKIYRLCYHFTENVKDALDLSQEVFLRAFRSLNEFRENANFYTWLYRITQNLCIDYTRHKKVISDFEIRYLNDIPSDSLHSFPYKQVEVKELGNEVSKALNKLSSKMKSMFILRYYEGLDYKSISEILGCRVSAVKGSLFQGKRTLKKILSPYLKDELETSVNTYNSH